MLEDKFKALYIHVLKTLENTWNNSNNGIKLLTCKASSSSLPGIFFADQFNVNLVFGILTNTF